MSVDADASMIDSRLQEEPSDGGSPVAREVVRAGLSPVAGGAAHPAFVEDQSRDAVAGELSGKVSRGPPAFTTGTMKEHDRRQGTSGQRQKQGTRQGYPTRSER